MSDTMLLGVLRMPVDESDPLCMAQFVQRARQAADRIESDAAEIARLQSEAERLRGRCEFLEGSIKNAIGWIDGDLRDIIRDVGNQICNYNDLYESAYRIEHLLAEALRQQAAESENG